ncbi:hypothetical protein ABID59_005752 [Bradyrhizobium sp. S3.3.6]
MSTDDFVPDDPVLGEIDGAWKQAISELAWASAGGTGPHHAPHVWNLMRNSS